jgi:DNA gyrase subunit A
MERPDLSGLPAPVLAYIEFLESRVASPKPGKTSSDQPAPSGEITYQEAPGPVNILTFSQGGAVKRTPRYLFPRQHRAGMGIFDLDVPEHDPIGFLSCVEYPAVLLLFSNKAKVYRYSLEKIEESPVRSKGLLLDRLALDSGERIIAALPERASGNVVLAGKYGFVRCLRHHLFGEHMRPGTAMINTAEHGPLAAVHWSDANEDILLVSRNGIGIRFPEKVIPPAGARGLNLAGDDQIVAVMPVDQDSNVFVAAADGKGTIRQMSGFAANKSAGGSGKILFKSTPVVGAEAVLPEDDLFMISRQGKIIRFLADEVPLTEGTVQGVNCMSLRADEAAAITIGKPYGN